MNSAWDLLTHILPQSAWVYISLVSLSRISKINMFHPSSAKTHTLMRDAALLARFSAVRHTAFPSGARQTLTLFIFGLLHGLTGRPPFLQLRRGDEASSARGNVLAGLPPVVIILTYNLQSNSHQFSLVHKMSQQKYQEDESILGFIHIKIIDRKIIPKVQGSFKKECSMEA
jgi:hypothetical protein